MPFLVYAIALVIAAGTLALSVNLATAPNNGASTQRIAAAPDVRQIAITKQADVSRGDPHNKLSPVYPAAPGKDLPPLDGAGDKAANNDPAVSAQSDKPAQAASVATTESTGAAPKEDNGLDQRDAAAMAPVATPTAAAANSCAVDVCSSAYRSFRVSDCTYQPFDGPRKICDLPAGGAQNASITPEPRGPQQREVAPRSRVPNRVTDLDAAARVVRQLPEPDEFDNARGRVIVIEQRPARYAPRVVYEEW